MKKTSEKNLKNAKLPQRIVIDRPFAFPREYGEKLHRICGKLCITHAEFIAQAVETALEGDAWASDPAYAEATLNGVMGLYPERTKDLRKLRDAYAAVDGANSKRFELRRTIGNFDPNTGKITD